jgi:hypothetical protein
LTTRKTAGALGIGGVCGVANVSITRQLSFHADLQFCPQIQEQLSTLVLIGVVQAGRPSMKNEFKNEVFSSYNPNPVRICSQCDKKPTLVRAMLNPKSGRTVRMFKCECGEQTWSEDKA